LSIWLSLVGVAEEPVLMVVQTAQVVALVVLELAQDCL
jgi:hypothetical protein